MRSSSAVFAVLLVATLCCCCSVTLAGPQPHPQPLYANPHVSHELAYTWVPAHEAAPVAAATKAPSPAAPPPPAIATTSAAARAASPPFIEQTAAPNSPPFGPVVEAPLWLTAADTTALCPALDYQVAAAFTRTGRAVLFFLPLPPATVTPVSAVSVNVRPNAKPDTPAFTSHMRLAHGLNTPPPLPDSAPPPQYSYADEVAKYVSEPIVCGRSLGASAEPLMYSFTYTVWLVTTALYAREPPISEADRRSGLRPEPLAGHSRAVGVTCTTAESPLVCPAAATAATTAAASAPAAPSRKVAPVMMLPPSPFSWIP